ncbi:MAG: hypothetical protein KFF73_16165 [Cyclobacteriaceae bacterium]|nr:hypothetical protein [Cyclobacteriaceae bacterium]
MDSVISARKERAVAVERLIALWALSESGLGGILHALQIPLKGIMINGFSVLLITLLAFYSVNRFRDILKGLVIVLVIKAMVSPHTPPTAYLAVAFQGLLGAFLFGYVRNIRTSAFLLAVLTFLESALQRLLMLTIIFGNPFWESIDVFFDFILKEFNLIQGIDSADASYWVIGLYVGIYFVAGVAVGIFAGGFPERINRIKIESIPEMNLAGKTEIGDKNVRRKPWWKKKKYNLVLMLVLITLILYFLSSEYDLSIGIYVFFRTLLVIGIWYLLLAPVLLKLFTRFLKKQEKKYAREIEKTMLYLPELRGIARISWEQSREKRGMRRISFFLEILLARVLFKQPG